VENSATLGQLEASTKSLHLSGDVGETARLMREMARGAKRTGYLCVTATLVIGLSILMTFLLFSQVVSQQRFEKQKAAADLVIEREHEARAKYFEVLDRLSKIPESVPKDDPQRLLLGTLITSIASADRREPDQGGIHALDSGPFDEILYNITSSVIRVGAVLIGIFLIQIMVSFARYYFKISEHLSMTASLITLSGGKTSDLKAIAPMFLPEKIDFGKAPASPVEKLFDGAFRAIGELSKKIPSR
jgi:hypothetical protein